MTINPNAVIEERLAAGFGLEQYTNIVRQMPLVNVASDIPFQTKFNAYYRVRRNAEWRRYYYGLFERGKKT